MHDNYSLSKCSLQNPSQWFTLKNFSRPWDGLHLRSCTPTMSQGLNSYYIFIQSEIAYSKGAPSDDIKSRWCFTFRTDSSRRCQNHNVTQSTTAACGHTKWAMFSGLKSCTFIVQCKKKTSWVSLSYLFIPTFALKELHTPLKMGIS